MENKINPKKQSKLSRLIKAPFKFLIKARDFYINGMNEYSDRIACASVMGCPTGQAFNNSLPKSFSVNSSKSSTSYGDDYRELLRAASAREYGSRIQLNHQLHRQQTANYRPNNNHMPRSFSVGIGRIDEDKPCDFEDVSNVKDVVFPRSRSYAVGNRRTTYGVH